MLLDKDRFLPPNALFSIHSFKLPHMKLFFKYTFYLTLILICVVFIVLWVKSPGTVEPLLDVDGKVIPKSISEHRKIRIGKHEQHLTIQGVDSTKEVLLMLHGGPGNSINAGLRHPDLRLNKEFVMVQWDQLGSGRSYNTKINAEEMKVEQMVSYAVEVSQYLKTRFKKEKIHVLGHSWGAHLGMILVHQHPELFHSYIGMAQTTDLYDAERIAFEWVKKRAVELKDKTGIEALSKIKFPDEIIPLKEWNDRFGWVHRSYVNKYGGVEYGEEKGIITGLLYPLLETPEYTIKQKINYITGLQYSLDVLWEERLERNLFDEIDSIAIPVIIVHGLHDFNIPHSQAKEFYDGLKAPYKKFYSFEYSAHSPYMEEADKFNSVISNELVKKF